MKKAYIITGGESTGSVFISKCISESMGYAGWDGYRFYSPNENITFLHRSQPYGVDGTAYSPYSELAQIFNEHECRYIICTRDLTCSNNSKKQRRSRQKKDLETAHVNCKSIISEIVNSNEKYFIWNYEAMVYLNDIYFNLLYDFLEIRIDARKYPEVVDGNRKYLI